MNNIYFYKLFIIEIINFVLNMVDLYGILYLIFYFFLVFNFAVEFILILFSVLFSICPPFGLEYYVRFIGFIFLSIFIFLFDLGGIL